MMDNFYNFGEKNCNFENVGHLRFFLKISTFFTMSSFVTFATSVTRLVFTGTVTLTVFSATVTVTSVTVITVTVIPWCCFGCFCCCRFVGGLVTHWFMNFCAVNCIAVTGVMEPKLHGWVSFARALLVSKCFSARTHAASFFVSA